MLQGIIRWSLKARFLVVAVAASLAVLAVMQMRAMPVDVLPEVSPPYVEIQTESLGLSAEEVEQLITVPIEQDLLNGVPWLDTIRSNSAPGLSSIVLVFKPGTDLLRARQMVAERLTQAVALPHVSKPPTMLQPLSTASRVMMIGLSSKELSLIQMSIQARWTIGPRLMGVPGVANVSIWGQRDWQLQVQIDPQRLRAQNVTLLDVLETTGNALWVSSLSFVEASTPGTGGFIDSANQRLGVRHISPIVTPDGLALVPISDRKKSDGTPLRLSDVANVVEDHQPLIGDAIVGDGAGLLLVVEKLPGANTLAVTRGIEEALQEMQPGLPGVKIDTTLYRPASFIEMGLHNYGLALLLGALLMSLVLALFLFDWRTAVISLAATASSLLAGGLVLYLRGATLNSMILAGFVVAAGIVVDDAIIDVENVKRRLRRQREEGGNQPAATTILEASLEMRSSIIFATLIILLAALPVLFLAGNAGAFFEAMTVSYGLAVLASMLVALTLTPALCLILLANTPGQERSFAPAARLRRSYEATLARLAHSPLTAVAILVSIVLVALAVSPMIRTSLLPNFKERDLLVQLQGAPGMSQPEMSRISTRISQELRTLPGVRDIGAHIGRAVRGDQIVNVDAAEMWVSIDPAADYNSTAGAIRRVVSGYPGLSATVQTYLNETSSRLVPPSDSSVVVRVYGDVDAVLRSKAQDVQKAVKEISGVSSTRIDLPVEQPTFETQVDIAAAQRYGLKPGDVRRAAATLLSGIGVGSLFEEQKVFDVVVWSTPETRSSLSSILDLLIDAPGGQKVRLGDVAQVRIVPTASIIRHEAVKRYLDVIAGVKGRSVGAVAADVGARLEQIEFPLEYHAEVLGAYAQAQAIQTELLLLAVAAMIAIFLLLQAAFGSWRLAFVAIVTLPVALAGGVLGAALGGGVISLGSLAGLLTVLGIAVRNGIVMTAHFHHLERHEGETFGLGLITRGARDRLSPILMTAVATVAILAPALLMGDVPGLEMARPAAAVIMGGLLTTVLLDLFALPVLYLRYGANREPELSFAPPAPLPQEAMPGGMVEVPAMSGGK